MIPTPIHAVNGAPQAEPAAIRHLPPILTGVLGHPGRPNQLRSGRQLRRCIHPAGADSDVRSGQRASRLSSPTLGGFPVSAGRPSGPRLHCVASLRTGECARKIDWQNTPTRGGSAQMMKGGAGQATSITQPAHGGASPAVATPRWWRPRPMYLRLVRKGACIHTDSIGTEATPQSFARKPAMPCTVRLTTRTVEEIEDVMDAIDRIFADGIVEPHELEELRREASEAHYAAGYADASFAYGMSAMRNGPDARRTSDLARNLNVTYGHNVADFTAHKARRRDCSPDDAA